MIARGRIAETVPSRFSSDETLDIGEDAGTPVVRDYKVPFRFNGTIDKVVIDLKPDPAKTVAFSRPAGTRID